MASAGLLALLDDIATVLDDVAVMAKVATKRTIAIAGDDLAVGAEALVGLHPSRELPIVWTVTKGSLLNKAWLVPAALILTLIAPWVLTPLLMIGGAFLCYEGVHKGLEKLGLASHHHDEHAAPRDPVALERSRVRGAIRTDVILSAEIVVIALSSMEGTPFWTKVLALSLVAIGLTFAIYGLIAVIVKSDDVGLHLVKRGGATRHLGKAIVATMPWLMKLIGVLGTIAMFLVGGGILIHGVPGLEPWLHDLVHGITDHAFLAPVLTQVFTLIVGVVAGFVVIGAARALGPLLRPLWGKLRAAWARRRAS